MTIFNTYRPQRTILYMSMAQERLIGLDHPIGDPWGGPAYGEKLKGGWVGQQLGSIGDAISGAVQSIGDVVSDIGSAIDRNVIQPVYQNVIQPVGNAFEKIGQQIAADPLTFVAQVAAIAAAPFTAGQSLWALPVIAAASTAAHGGSIEQILTATAISAATAWAGGAMGPGTGISGLVNGIASNGMQCVPTFMGQAVNYGTQQILTQVATGVTMAGINAIGAAAQGRDALQAALPSLIGTAAGISTQSLAQMPAFQELGAALNSVGENLGGITQTTLTGLTSAVLKQAVTGRDMSAQELSTLLGGLTSATYAVGRTFTGTEGTYVQESAAVQGVLSAVASNVMSNAFMGGAAGDQLISSTASAVMRSLTTYAASGDFMTLVDRVQNAYTTAQGDIENVRLNTTSLQDLTSQRNLLTTKANAELQKVIDAKSAFDTEYGTYTTMIDRMNNGGTAIDTNRRLGWEGEVIYAPKGTIVAYGANGAWSYKTVGDSGAIALNNDTFGDPINGTYKAGYIVTQGGYTMADLNAQADKVQNTITNYNRLNEAVGNAFNTVYVPQVNELDSKLKSTQEAIDASANSYANNLRLADAEAQKLAIKENEMTQLATKAAVMEMNPQFNADQYKQINGLGGGVDAYSHYLSTGKYEGLAVNMDQAGGPINAAYSALLTDIAKRMGYNSYIEIPKDVLADTQDKLTGMFGNNLSALQNASVDSILASNPELKVSDLMTAPTPESVNAAIKSFMADNKSLGSYQPSATEFQMPHGYQYATQTDIAKAMLGQGGSVAKAVDNTGQTVYIKQTPAATVYKQEIGGNMVQTASALNDMITAQNTSGAEKLALIATGDTATMKYIGQVLGPQYVANYASGMNQTDSATLVDNMVSEIRKTAQGIYEKAADPEGLFIYKAGAKALDTAAMTLDGLAQVTASATFLESMFRGVNPNDQPSMQITKALTGMSDAMRSDDMKAAIQSLNTAMKTPGMDVVGAVLNNAADNPAGMINFIGTNLVAMLPGIGLGKWVGAGTGASAATSEITSWTQAAVQKLIGSNSGVTAARLSEVAMEAGNNGLQAFNEARALLQKQNPTWSAAQLDDEAMSRAKLVAGTAALTTIGTQVIGLDRVTTNLLGPNNPGASAFQSVLNKLVTSPIAEITQEGLQSGIPAAIAEVLYKEIDSSRTIDTAIGNIAGQTTLGMISGAGSSVAIGSLQTIQDIPALAVQTNNAFTAAIKSSNYTIGELGTVINQWIPPSTSTAVGPSIISEIRNTVVADQLLSNPAYAANYSNANDFIEAVKTATGVWDATVLADTAAKVDNGKFASQVTTLAQAKQMLAAQGLVDITDQDALNAGLVGATKTNFPQVAANYADANMVGLEELQAAAKQENYDASANELNALVGRGVEATAVQQFIQQIDPKAVTTAEATQYFANLGYDKATAADIAQFVKSAPESTVQQAVAQWVDPRQVTRQEAINFFAQQGYTPTEAEIAQYVVQGPEVVQANIQRQLGEYVDPRYVTAEEVRSAFQNLGLEAPVSASDIARLSGQYAESELAGKAEAGLPVVSANAVYSLLAGNSIASQQVKDQILAKIEDYKNLGMDQAAAQAAATQAVAVQLGTTKTDLLSALGATEQNLMAQLGDTKATLLSKIEEYKNQGYSSDQAIRAAVDTVANNLGTTRSELLTQLGTTESGLKTYVSEQVSATETRLADLIAKNEAAGMARSEATQAAIDALSGELGTTRTDLLSKIDLTSQQFQNEISIAKTDLNKQITLYGEKTNQQITDAKTQIQQQMQAYEQAGIDRDTALGLAISGVAQDLGTTKTDLLTQLNTSEANLKAELTAKTQALSTQVQDVAALLGKPVSQVTANDITMVQNMIAGQTQTNLAYDVNQDQKVDATDLALIQQQQQIQQGQNVTKTVDPTTGLPVYTDTTTGKVITGFTPTATSPWAPTGIYSVLEQQKAQQAATAQAQAATAKQTAQKQNFSQMMQMVLGAPDAAGQKVEVKEAPLAQIRNIYDFSSIFATPQQASMFPSPYGPVNTYGQNPQQGGIGGLGGMYGQAANQSMYKQASGFAEGGMINNDISVGDGGGVDDLLNILKGNG